MNDRLLPHPALDVAWRPSACDVAVLHELLAAALDDPQTTAIHELDSSWRVFFASAAARDRAARALDRDFRPLGVVISPIEIADEDWARRSQAELGPVRIGRLVIAPPWSVLAASEVAGAVVIRILPSMGFGTGHHATTRLCLKALCELDLAHRSFLDVGTGSGVLAIAACLLGARPVSAIDSDPNATRSARDNLRLNGVDGRVRLITCDFRRGANIRARTVAANLTGAALVHGHLDLAACVEPGGMLVVSGFMHDEADDVLSTLAQVGELTNRYGEDGWCAATLRVFAQTETRHD